VFCNKNHFPQGLYVLKVENDYSKTIFIVGCFQSIGSSGCYGTEEVDASLSDSGEVFVIDCRISPIISSKV
jgi:hypothetical protein